MSQIAKALQRANYLTPVANALNIIAKAKKYDEAVQQGAELLSNFSNVLKNTLYQNLYNIPNAEQTQKQETQQQPEIQPIEQENIQPQTQPEVQPKQTQPSSVSSLEQVQKLIQEQNQRQKDYEQRLRNAQQAYLNLSRDILNLTLDPNMPQEARNALEVILKNATSQYQEAISGLAKPEIKEFSTNIGKIISSGEKSVFVPDVVNNVVTEKTPEGKEQYYIVGTNQGTGEILYKKPIGSSQLEDKDAKEKEKEIQKRTEQAQKSLNDAWTDLGNFYSFAKSNQIYYEPTNDKIIIVDNYGKEHEVNDFTIQIIDDILGSTKKLKINQYYPKVLSKFKDAFDNLLVETTDSKGNPIYSSISDLKFIKRDLTNPKQPRDIYSITDHNFYNKYLIPKIKQYKSKTGLYTIMDEEVKDIVEQWAKAYGLDELATNDDVAKNIRESLKHYMLGRIIYYYNMFKQ